MSSTRQQESHLSADALIGVDWRLRNYAVVAQTVNGWACESYAVPYDNVVMAKLAKARGRLDWERALLRGYAR